METIKDFFFKYLRYFLAKDDTTATEYDKYLALSYAVRSELVDGWIQTQKEYHTSNKRRVYFLSMEYMFGRNLLQNIVSLGLYEGVQSAALELGFDLENLTGMEDDFNLGNGGKGRLAACFQDAMATLAVPGMGYGLRYDFAQFRQQICNGIQTELPYDWLHKGHPWEIIRPEYACEVHFKGECVPSKGQNGPGREWINTETVIAIPYDFPVPGYKNGVVNTLRFWSARASETFPEDYQRHGDYVKACEEKSLSGTLTNVLLPEADILRITEQRLKQQYFFVAASLQDIIRRYKQHNRDVSEFDARVAIQLNGSRCAFAVPELMRLLVDVEEVEWDRAWQIVCNVFSYTSHAVSKVDLESWPLYMMDQLFPRHVEIIYEINQRFLDFVGTRTLPAKVTIPDLSLVEEGEVKRLRMGQLSVLGSKSVNGVSLAQTELLRQRVYPHFHALYPKKIINITNGVAHRRWLLCAHTPLAALLTELVGDEWIHDPLRLQSLEEMVENREILFRLSDIKHTAKRKLAGIIQDQFGVEVDSHAMFDVQSKKIHPYKRQMLHLLYIVSRYLRLRRGDNISSTRVHLFAGRASPNDHLGKQIVLLIHLIQEMINNDPVTDKSLKLLFVPDYGVSWAERLVPAADLSEQIATPGMEASGTSNMKFAFDGALTIASYSGSNIEILNAVGRENMFMFGMKESQLPRPDTYRPDEIIARQPMLAEIFSLLEKVIGDSPNGQSLLPLIATLRDTDAYYVLADFEDYCRVQEEVDRVYANPTEWSAKTLVTIARMGYFSSDRTVAEYAKRIWKVKTT